MFFIKVIPLVVYSWIFKSKAKGLGNYYTYTISFLTVLFSMHLVQLGIIFFYFVELPDSKIPGEPNELVLWIILIGGYFLISYLLSKVYTQERLGRWYVEYKEKRIIKFRTLIVWVYMFVNLALALILSYLH